MDMEYTAKRCFQVGVLMSFMSSILITLFFNIAIYALPTRAGGPQAGSGSGSSITITGISPGSVAAESGNTPITISGTGLSSSNTVTFQTSLFSEGTVLSSTFMNGTLRATIPQSLLTQPGNFSIIVAESAGSLNIASGSFTVTAAGGGAGGGGTGGGSGGGSGSGGGGGQNTTTLPRITGVTYQAFSGNAGVLNVTGENFNNTSVIYKRTGNQTSGGSLGTSLVSATQLQAQPGALTAGTTYNILVSNRNAQGQLVYSNVYAFTFVPASTVPTPHITSVTKTTSGNVITIIVRGTGFTNSSVIRVNGSGITTNASNASAGTLTGTISSIGAFGQSPYTVTVRNGTGASAVNSDNSGSFTHP